MMRIALFVLTNLALLIVAYIALGILGVDSVLKENGVDMDLGNLLVLSAVFGMAGSFVSRML